MSTLGSFEYLPVEHGLLRFGEVERVAGALRAGRLAVLPTETGYLLAALASSEKAVLRAFEAKGRDLANPMHVACSSMRMLAEFGTIGPLAGRLLRHFTPGPLTVVVRQAGLLPDRLVTLNGTVGLRVPQHPATLQVIEAVGAPVTATSVNRAGEAPSGIDDAVLSQLSWPADGPVLVVADDESIRYSMPSTLVRVDGDECTLLRAGPVTAEQLQRIT